MKYKIKISRPMMPDAETVLESTSKNPVTVIDIFSFVGEIIQPGDPLNFVASCTEILDTEI